MKRVLIITYYWPPSGGSGVQRWLKFSKYLPQNGWEPIIYTPLNPSPNAIDETLLKEIPEGTIVLKRKIFEPYALYNILSGRKKNTRIKANVISSSNDGNGTKGGLFLYIRANFFIPDPRILWVRPSVRFLACKIKEYKIDAIVSTGPPHSVHLIARNLHREVGVPWIADFRDPWTKMFYFKHLPLSKRGLKKHIKLERSVLEEADIVTAVTPSVKGEFEEMLSSCRTGETRDNRGKNKDARQGKFSVASEPLKENESHTKKSKVKLITNGYDPADFSLKENASLRDAVRGIFEETKEKFVIVHTGLITKDANPELFWEAVASLCRGEVDGVSGDQFRRDLYIAVMGQTDAEVSDTIFNAGLKEYLHDLGYASHILSVGWQMRGNLLLLPLRKEPEAKAILPGKFFEYVASFTPMPEEILSKKILAVGPVDSNLGEALSDTGTGTIVEYSDREGMIKEISATYKDFCNGKKKRDPVEKYRANRAKYSRIELSASMAQLLERISKSNGL